MNNIVDRFNSGVCFEDLYEPDTALRFCVLHSLKDAVGHDNRLSGKQFIKSVQGLWLSRIDNRKKPPSGKKIRDTLRFLRQQGVLVVSTGGTQGGYWIPDSFEEIKVFGNIEFRKKSLTMLYTYKCMIDAGRREFGGQASIWKDASSMSRQYQSVISILGR